jgi:hypothetical protein
LRVFGELLKNNVSHPKINLFKSSFSPMMKIDDFILGKEKRTCSAEQSFCDAKAMPGGLRYR